MRSIYFLYFSSDLRKVAYIVCYLMWGCARNILYSFLIFNLELLSGLRLKSHLTELTMPSLKEGLCIIKK